MQKQWILMTNVVWRYLIVLDACRPDVLAEVVQELGIRGNLCACDSQALDTRMWLKRHWSGPEGGTVLVSGHPYAWHKDVLVAWNFGHQVAPWKADENLGRGGVVHPERMVACARTAIAAWPDKRFVIHLVQPHLPYIHPAGLSFLETEMGVAMGGADWLKENPRVYDRVQAYGRQNGWGLLRGLYHDSLMATMVALIPFLDELGESGVVVTADHSELIGEGAIYGHPRTADAMLLRRVPWLEYVRGV